MPRIDVCARSLLWAVPAQATEVVCPRTPSVSSASGSSDQVLVGFFCACPGTGWVPVGCWLGAVLGAEICYEIVCKLLKINLLMLIIFHNLYTVN